MKEHYDNRDLRYVDIQIENKENILAIDDIITNRKMIISIHIINHFGGKGITCIEDLINKIKTAGHDENINMDTVNSHFNEYRKNVDHIIREKLIKEAKELIQDINSMDFN